jgi:hypothetical protein
MSIFGSEFNGSEFSDLEERIKEIARPIIAERMAVAWDEGYAKAMETAMSTEAFQDDVNPYRPRPSEPDHTNGSGERG